MNWFSLFLLDKGLIRLSLRNVKWWVEKRKISFLEYAVQNGIHTIRREAIIGLGILHSQNSKSILIDSVDDRFKGVSLAAIKALKTMSPTIELTQRMKAKEEYWEGLKNKYEPIEKWKTETPRWEGSSKKNF